MAWSYNCSWHQVAVKGQPPAAIYIHWFGRESTTVFPFPTPSAWLLKWSGLHSFLYSNKDSFLPFTEAHGHTRTHTLTFAHSAPQTHVDSRIEDMPMACTFGETTAFVCCCQNQMHISPSLSCFQWHWERRLEQIWISLRSSHISLLLSKEQFWLFFFFNLVKLKNKQNRSNSPISPTPPPSCLLEPPVCSLYLLICGVCYCYLDSMHKGDHTVFFFFCLTYFT